MKREDILPQLLHPAPGYVCEGSGAGSARFRVPLVHRRLDCFYTGVADPAGATAALSALKGTSSAEQLRSLVDDGRGYGLLVPKLLLENEQPEGRTRSEEQMLAGTLVVFPPHEWNAVKADMLDWFFDGIEAGFAGLPYTAEDILPFAGVNFSPDRWFLVLRGPMAGNVCWWTHDGDSVMNTPWANDIHSWAARFWDELPESIGGGIFLDNAWSVDAVPESEALEIAEYVPDLKLG